MKLRYKIVCFGVIALVAQAVRVAWTEHNRLNRWMPDTYIPHPRMESILVPAKVTDWVMQFETEPAAGTARWQYDCVLQVSFDQLHTHLHEPWQHAAEMPVKLAVDEADALDGVATVSAGRQTNWRGKTTVVYHIAIPIDRSSLATSMTMPAARELLIHLGDHPEIRLPLTGLRKEVDSACSKADHPRDQSR